MSILVNHHLAVQTLNVKNSIIKLYVLVCHLILEVPLVVVPNVLSALNVPTIKPVQIKSVLILVQILAVKMPNVE